MEILLNSFEKVVAFTKLVAKLDDNIDLCSGRCYVDAKSILGILSLDLSRPMKVEFNGSKHQASIAAMISEFAAEPLQNVC